MRREIASGLAALLGLGLSCSGFLSQRSPEDPAPLLKAVGAGPDPSVQVSLSGGATEPQQRACRETVARLGVTSPPEPEVSAVLDLSADPKVLTVTSKKKGQVLKEERPAWYLDELCADALAAALRAWGAENGRKLPPPPALAAEDRPGDDGKDKPKKRRRAQARAEQARAADSAVPAARKSAEKGAEKDPWGKL